MQRCRDKGTETQRHRDTETQKHRDADSYRQRDTETQKHREPDTLRQRHRDTATFLAYVLGEAFPITICLVDRGSWLTPWGRASRITT